MNRWSPRIRSGWSLLEMLVVLSLMTLLLSGSAMLLTALFRSQAALSADIQQESTRARLTMQLRSDAHWSRSAQCDSKKECVLTWDDKETVHYVVGETAIVREERLGADITLRESYLLDRVTADFSLTQSEGLTFVQMDLKPDGETITYAPPPRSSHLEAAIGSLRRDKVARGAQP